MAVCGKLQAWLLRLITLPVTKLGWSSDYMTAPFSVCSMSLIGPIVVLFVVILCSGFRLRFNNLFCFITVFVTISVPLYFFKGEVDDPYANRTYVCTLQWHSNSGLSKKKTG